MANMSSIREVCLQESLPGPVRKCMLLLLEQVRTQGSQLSRLEDVITSLGAGTQTAGSVWRKIANKADLSRVEVLEGQMATLQEGTPDVARRLHQLQLQMNGLEARLGITTAAGGRKSQSNLLSSSSGTSPSTLTHVESAFDRITRLERRLEGASESLGKHDEEASDLCRRMRELEMRVDMHLNNIRNDVKHAITLSGKALRNDCEVMVAASVRETEKKLAAKTTAVEEDLTGKVATVEALTHQLVTTELNKHIQVVCDSMERELGQMQAQVDQLAQDKAEVQMFNQYTDRVTEIFEKLASNLSASQRASLEGIADDVSRMKEDLMQLREKKVEMKTWQVHHDATGSRLEGLAAAVDVLQQAVEEVASGLVGPTRAVEDNRTATQQLQGQVDTIQKALSTVTKSFVQCSNTVEGHSRKIQQWTQNTKKIDQDVVHLKGVLLGTEGDLQDGGGMMSRLNNLATGLKDLHECTAHHVDKSHVVELDKKLQSLQKQVNTNTDGVRALTNTTYKRVDEHAVAIQKLSQAITESLEDRPTTAVIRTMLQDVSQEGRTLMEALGAEWQCHSQQVRDITGEALDKLQEVERQLADVEQRVDTLQSWQITTSSTEHHSQLVGQVVEECMQSLKEDKQDQEHQLADRRRAWEQDLQRMVAQLQVHAQLQDRHTTLLTALDQQVAQCQLTAANVKDGLDKELEAMQDKMETKCRRMEDKLTQVEGKAAERVARVEAKMDDLRGRLHQTQQEVQQDFGHLQSDIKNLQEGLGSRPDMEEVRIILENHSKKYLKAELQRYLEKEDGRWQVWLERFSQDQEQKVSRDELQCELTSLTHKLVQEVATCTQEEWEQVLSRLKAELTGEVAALGSRLTVLEGKSRDVKELDDLLSSLATREALDEVHEQLAQLQEQMSTKLEVEDLRQELAKKVDVRTFLASSAANAQAVATGAVFASLAGTRSPSPSRKSAPQRQPSSPSNQPKVQAVLPRNTTDILARASEMLSQVSMERKR